jgi:DNA-binding NarL/FixJ family response regulator
MAEVDRMVGTGEAKRDVKVLVVDDSLTVRDRIVRLVKEVKGVEVVGQAESARQAIAAIREARPQIVILDLYMPGESGLVVLETFRADAERPKFIVFTNYASAQYRRKCLDAGAAYVLDKSNDFEHLPEAVARLGGETLRGAAPGRRQPLNGGEERAGTEAGSRS